MVAGAARSQEMDADNAGDPFVRDLAERGYALIDLSGDPAVISLCDRAVADLEPERRAGATRIQDAWRQYDSVRALAGLEVVATRLRTAYDAEPFPFQTLNFFQGSQQSAHSDLIHFTPDPIHLMCGVWLALEDVAPDAGPLFYYPGSHRLPVMTLADAGAAPGVAPEAAYAQHYEPAMRARMAGSGLSRDVALLKKGWALVWASNLVHGGTPVTNPASTRRSLVTHYFFRDCAYYTLMTSSPGRRAMRLPTDIRTGRFVWPRGSMSLRARTVAAECLVRARRRPVVYRAPAAPKET